MRGWGGVELPESCRHRVEQHHWVCRLLFRLPVRALAVRQLRWSQQRVQLLLEPRCAQRPHVVDPVLEDGPVVNDGAGGCATNGHPRFRHGASRFRPSESQTVAELDGKTAETPLSVTQATSTGTGWVLPSGSKVSLVPE